MTPPAFVTHGVANDAPPPIRPGDMAALLFALDAHLELAARAAAETLESIGAARARLVELRRMVPWATLPADTE